MGLKQGETYTQQVEAKIVAEADVVVAGGGTAGVTAAIAAARQGARTILIERRGILGGMMTWGNAGLTKYCVHEKSQAEYREVLELLRSNPEEVQVAGGLTMEMTRRLIDEGYGLGTADTAGSYVFTSSEDFKLLLFDMMEEAGVELMLYCMVVDVVCEDDRVAGVVIESKEGRQVIAAHTVIDATGDGDLAARAGCPYELGIAPTDLTAREMDIEPGTMQPMGVMFRCANIDLDRLFEHLRNNRDEFVVQHFALLGLEEAIEAHENGEMMTINVKMQNHRFQIYNTPVPGVCTFCCPSFKGNDLSVKDMSEAEVAVRREVKKRLDEMRQLPGFENVWLIDVPEMGVRETRHFRGEFVLDIEDVFAMKAYPDTIGKGGHPVDINPVPPELKKYPLPKRWHFNIPYRALVAKGADNVLLAGRCISATHEASGCARPTVQCMITGEAAGTAAAMCARENVAAREVDTDALRAILKDNGAVL